MSEPLPVTVVIPAYNRPAMVKRAVLSALDQRPRPPAEVIVVDDCSSDDTAAVASAAGATVIRHDVNRGGAAARNTAIRAAAYVAGVVIAVPHGLVAVSWTVVGVTAVSFLVLQDAVVERVVGIPLLETLRDAVPALCSGLILLATAWLGVRLLDPALPDLLVMLVPGIVALAVYALVLRVLFAATWRDLAVLVSSLRPRSG